MKITKPKFRVREKDRSPPDISVGNGNYELKGRIWLEGSSGTFLGYGRVVLLERIKKYGSISKAARSMGMSYRHAWELVDSINRNAKSPLVITSIGGKGGGGAQVTREGERAIEFFWRLYSKFETFLKEEMKGRDF